MPQIRSGQSFLYRNAGYDSTILEITMKEPVSGSAIHAALGYTAQRFPYMTDKLVEKDGCYYLVPNHNGMIPAATAKFRPLGSMATGYHLLDVTYYKRLIRVAFHHGLCDGRGVQPFVETLLYYYCCEKYRESYDATGIRLKEEAPDPQESAEPFGTDFFPFEEGKVHAVNVRGFRLPEATAAPKVTLGTEFLLEEATFVAHAKAIGATPAIFLSMLLSGCIAKCNPHAEAPVVCNMAMDLRGPLGAEKTHRNCVASVALPYDAQKPWNVQAQLYRRLLRQQREPDAVRASINQQIGLFNRLDGLPTLDEKREVMAFFDTLISDTYVVSYLGQLRLNDYAKHVRSARFYCGGIRGLTVNMLSAAGIMSVQVLCGFDESKYAEAFRAALRGHGLIEASETMPVITGRDASHVTASRQLERWFMRGKYARQLRKERPSRRENPQIGRF